MNTSASEGDLAGIDLAEESRLRLILVGIRRRSLRRLFRTLARKKGGGLRSITVVERPEVRLEHQLNGLRLSFAGGMEIQHILYLEEDVDLLGLPPTIFSTSVI